YIFFFSSRRRHTRSKRDWSSDVCSSDLKTALVIMAAGLGSRFGKGIKQLAKVGPQGEIIMEYSIHDALEAGFNKVVFIIRKDIEIGRASCWGRVYNEVLGS